MAHPGCSVALCGTTDVNSAALWSFLQLLMLCPGGVKSIHGFLRIFKAPKPGSS